MTGHRPQRILLIENDPAEIRLIEELLRSYAIDYELTCHRDCRDAMLQLFDGSEGIREVPDIIVIDYTRDRGDASPFLHALRTSLRLSKVPRVLISGLDRTELQDKDVAGARCVIRKS